jgi:heme iron utilization protein
MTNEITNQVRNLLLSSDYGTLSSHSADCPGYPFASIVPVGFDDFNRPIILISRLAQHTRNIAENAKLSLFLSDAGQRGYDDVQTCARMTILAQAQRLNLDADANTVQRYCRFYEPAESYYKELDFDFYRLEPEKVRFIAGFGQIHWVGPDQLFTKNPLSFAVEAGIVEHMNADHSDALIKYCQQAGLVVPKDSAPQMVGVDGYGFFQRLGERVVRFDFNEPVTNSTEVRKALIAKLRQ